MTQSYTQAENAKLKNGYCCPADREKNSIRQLIFNVQGLGTSNKEHRLTILTVN